MSSIKEYVTDIEIFIGPRIYALYLVESVTMEECLYFHLLIVHFRPLWSRLENPNCRQRLSRPDVCRTLEIFHGVSAEERDGEKRKLILWATMDRSLQMMKIRIDIFSTDIHFFVHFFWPPKAKFFLCSYPCAIGLLPDLQNFKKIIGQPIQLWLIQLFCDTWTNSSLQQS